MKKQIGCSVCGDHPAILLDEDGVYLLCADCVRERLDELNDYHDRYENLVEVVKILTSLLPPW